MSLEKRYNLSLNEDLEQTTHESLRRNIESLLSDLRSKNAEISRLENEIAWLRSLVEKVK